jgi:tripartite-type tricarboxylate transporter receptor subunit TctC
VKSGKLRVLAVMTPRRSGIFPDVPTVAESGYPGFEAAVWYGVIAPARLPPAILARLHAELQKALASDDLKTRLSSAGGEVLPGPVEQFTTLLNSEKARYEKLVREARIQPD